MNYYFYEHEAKVCGRIETTSKNCQNMATLKIINFFLFYDKFLEISKRSAVKVFWPKLPLNRREPENSILVRY